jgi:pimeloyl-ACP methyl ester carboxylesterase
MAVNPQHFTEIDGLRVQFRVRGKGEPLLLLHGWGATSLSFTSIAPQLEARFRVIAPDLPGFGFSDMPPKPWGAADYADTVEKLVETTGLGAVNVLGHSRGGVIGTALAVSRPDLVKRLVLVAAPVVRLQADQDVRSRIGGYGRVKFIANLLPPFKERILEWGRMKYGSEDYRQAGAMRPTMVKLLGEDWRNALPRVSVPTLLIYGEKDDDVPLAVAEQAMQSLPPSARLEVIEGAGHFPFIDKPDAFMAALTSFLLPDEAVSDA